jgi:hypothetical protein
LVVMAAGHSVHGDGGLGALRVIAQCGWDKGG